MKRTIFVMCILLTLTFFSCGSDNQDEKLYYAIDSNNLQATKEVIANTSNLDFQDLNHAEFTAFRKNDHRALSFALDGGADEAVIMELLNSGKINAKSDDNFTYLDWAVCNGFSLEICNALIANGADVNDGEKPVSESYLTFVYPGLTEKKERMDFLIENGAAINKELFTAIMKNEYRYLYAAEVLKFLEENNVGVEASEVLKAAILGDEQTLINAIQSGDEKLSKETLIFVAGSCNKKTLQQISAAGYDFNIRDNNGWTPLHVAAYGNDADVIEYLLRGGLDIYAGTGDTSDYSVLELAALGANKEGLYCLLENGGKLDENAWSAACSEETGKSIEYLLQAGYKPTKSDYYSTFVGSSDNVFKIALEKGFPFNIICENGIPVNDVESEERMKILLEQGAEATEETLCHAVDLRAYDAIDVILQQSPGIEKERALICAVQIGDLKTVESLVENGADINMLVEEENGVYTAMHTAAWSPSEDILKYLIDAGGDVNMKDGDGKTPYECAKDADLKANMKILK